MMQLSHGHAKRCQCAMPCLLWAHIPMMWSTAQQFPRPARRNIPKQLNHMRCHTLAQTCRLEDRDAWAHAQQTSE